jgi:hypothetical protein
MELKHRILELSGNEKYDFLKSELERLGVKYQIQTLGRIGTVEKTSLEYIIANDDPLYPTIAKLIQKYQFYVQSGIYYSESDIKHAEWLQIIAGEYQYPQPEDYKQTTYDLSNYCKHCGIGKVQNNPFRLKSDFVQKTDFLGLHWVFDEIFVRPNTKDIIENSGLGDIEFFHPLFIKTGKQIQNVYQMKIMGNLEHGLITNDLFTITCKENNEEIIALNKSGLNIGKLTGEFTYCNRVKYHHPKTTQITFKREIFSKAPQIVKSYEYFGSGSEAHQLILVSQRFAEVVRQHKLRGLKFTPVKLI